MKKVLWWFIALIILIVISAFLFINSMKPDYDGQVKLKNLDSKVKAYYDPYGIPHIYGKNEKDAFRALGYVHAQDRLWQMELLRRIGKGGLSELFGKDLLRTDKFFLALGIDDASEKTVAGLSSNDPGVQLTQAYLDGINEFIEQGPTPIEFYLTGIDKEPFVIKDVYNVMGYMAFSFAMAHKTDPLLTKIKEELGNEYLKDLAISSDTTTVWLKNHSNNKNDSVNGKLTAGIFDVLQKYHIPQFEGSNSWVLGAEITKNGKVIFANDPHIGFSQPSVWYEAHVSTPTYENYGYHLAGVPFPILGHNSKLAYGMTMFENDDVDFYYEDMNPDNNSEYRTAKGWQNFETVIKTIKVKDSGNIDFSYRKTNRGPVVNGIADGVEGERPISMWWIYTQEENKVMDALYGMSHAENLEEFESYLQDVHAPGLNIMYGDAEGNVAWWATAKLYHIPDSINTKLVYEKNNVLSAQKQYLDFSQNPHAINPPSNFVYSANNQPDSIAGMLYPGYYLPENRAKRIVQLLEPKNDWDKESVGAMLNDVTSSVDVEIVKSLLKQIDTVGLNDEQLELLDKLMNWNGTYTLKSTEATLYHKWVYLLLKDIFRDELDHEVFEQLLSTHLIKRTIAPLFSDTESIWWDNIKTDDKIETSQELVNLAFRKAYDNLKESLDNDTSKWTWNRVHTLEHGHPIGQVEALRDFFNIGPYPVAGSREVINNMFFPYSDDGEYKVSSGPSTRRLVDFSDVENSISILPTGQSGNPFSKHYKDQAQMYIDGKFRKMMLNKAEIESTSESLLIFEPK